MKGMSVRRTSASTFSGASFSALPEQLCSPTTDGWNFYDRYSHTMYLSSRHGVYCQFTLKRVVLGETTSDSKSLVIWRICSSLCATETTSASVSQLEIHPWRSIRWYLMNDDPFFRCKILLCYIDKNICAKKGKKFNKWRLDQQKNISQKKSSLDKIH